ncbi:holin [Arcanobacterium haemolyticum]|nr:holin [Arcanobacterium haemolyticum]
MEIYKSKTFWSGLAERAIKTFAQAFLAILAVGTAVWDLDWAKGFGVAATAALISILTSIGDPRRTDTAVTTGGGGVDLA